MPAGHPRLGGWADIAGDPDRLARLPAALPWAAAHIDALIDLEERGLEQARGRSLVHFDAYPHNILASHARVLLVDWPHARLGAPFLDLVLFASSAAAAGVDPEPLLAGQPVTASVDPAVINAVLAAHAGFCTAGSLERVPPSLAPIPAARAVLAHAATAWLARRLGRPG